MAVKKEVNEKIKKESIKVFDYSILLDIMAKASSFSKVTLKIPNMIDFEVVNEKNVIENEDNIFEADREVIFKNNTKVKAKRNEENIEEKEYDKGQEAKALKEQERLEELMFTDSDAYFEAIEKGELR